MSYRTPIERLADEVRHLTAKIPRMAAPAAYDAGCCSQIEAAIAEADCGATLTDLRNTSSRERDLSQARTKAILFLVGRGFDKHDIAKALNVSMSTINWRFR